MRSNAFTSNSGISSGLSCLFLGSALMLQGCGKGETSSETAQKATEPTSETPAAKPAGYVDGLVQAQSQPSKLVFEPSMELPPITLDPPVLDFGFIPPHAKVHGSVKLQNTSKQPITILAVQPTCKCTTLNNLAGTVVPAGGSVDLEAAMDGGPNPGPKTAAVKVLVDGFARPIEVDLKAEISLPIRAIPPYINAVREQNQRGRIVIESITGKPFKICSIHGKAPNLLNYDPATDEPQSKYIFAYDLSDIDMPYPRYLVVATDDPDVPVVDIYLRHESTMPNINRNIRVADGFRHPFGRIEKGGTAEIEIAFQNMREPIATVISGTKDARVSLLGSRNETVGDIQRTIYNIEVIPAKDFEGVLYFPITFLTNSGESADVPIFGLVDPKGGVCPEVKTTVESGPPVPAG